MANEDDIWESPALLSPCISHLPYTTARRRLIFMRPHRPLFALGFLLLLGGALYIGIPAWEVHRSLEELRRFESLMAAGHGAYPPEPPRAPPVLIVQHIWRRGPIEAASQRSHAAYASAWGYGYHFVTQSYNNEYQHVSLNKMYTLLEAMDAELAKAEPGEDGEDQEGEKRAEWILWCDADTIVRDPSVPVHHLLPPSTKQPLPLILATQDTQAFNGGVVLYRVHPETREFINRVIGDSAEVFSFRKLSDEHRMQALLRSEPRFADHFYRVPKSWMNAYTLHEAAGDGSGPWQPQLHVHFVKGRKEKDSFRPTLQHASATAEHALFMHGPRTKLAPTHPVQRMAENRWTKNHGHQFWAKAKAGIGGMRFLDEKTGSIIQMGE